MEVLVNDPFVNSTKANELGVQIVDLSTLLKTCKHLRFYLRADQKKLEGQTRCPFEVVYR